ncbi:Uncharacterised protein [BD1-7 clade bacterium]|uniref:Uncharacterized protein n=1 Tax=BD1-7 clade bacterium TaxID=2029982 RepID=A0A5S9NYC2_9GAMM|nr:Uncharacterised protein [BD1-7 clade bacterium]
MDTELDAYMKRAVALLIFAMVAGYLLTFGLNVVLARILEPAEYGDFKIAEAVIELGTLLVLMGGGSASFRFLTGSDDEAKSRAWEFFRIYTLLAIASSLLLLIGVAIYYAVAEPMEHHPLLWGILVLPISAGAYMLSCILQARQQIGYATIPWEIGTPLFCLIAIGILSVIDSSILTEEVAIGIFAAGIFFALVIKFLRTQKTGIMPMKSNPTQRRPRNWLSVSIPMMMISTLQILLFQIDIFMIEGIDKHENCVGYFAAASTTVALLNVATYIVLNMLTPLMPQVANQGQAAVKALNRRGIKLLLMICIPMAVGIAIFSHPLLSLFGEDSKAAHSSLLVLLIGYTFVTLSALPFSWLKYSGNERVLIGVLVAAVAMNATLNVLLIPRMHIVGAAVGTTAALIFSGLAIILIMRRRMGIWCF